MKAARENNPETSQTHWDRGTWAKCNFYFMFMGVLRHTKKKKKAVTGLRYKQY